MSSGSRLNHPVIRAPRHRCPRRKLTDGCIQRLDLDDEMTEARAEVDLTLDRIVDEFDGDELVPGQLEHGQVAQGGPGDAADDLVADGGI